MKTDANKLKQLAALHALGALDGSDAAAFAKMLGESEELRQTVSQFEAVTEAMAQSLPKPTLPPALKDKILRGAEKAKERAQAEAQIRALVPASQNGLAFLKNLENLPWIPLPVPGAFVKLLSFDSSNPYAVVLGKLEAGSRYPAHKHRKAEDIFMLTGDLHIGTEVIRSGDFHHADAGSHHGVNWSEEGCTLLCVISREDLLAQLEPNHSQT